jgi:hypothetical protein
MNNAERGLFPIAMCIDQVVSIQKEIKKYRVTYECAGEIFRAMILDINCFHKINLSQIAEMGLKLPDVLNPTFAEFLDENRDRLQLFDEPVVVVIIPHSYTGLGDIFYTYRQEGDV